MSSDNIAATPPTQDATSSDMQQHCSPGLVPLRYADVRALQESALPRRPNVAVGPMGEIYVVWAAGSWAASKTKPAAEQTTTKPKAATADASHAGHSGKGDPPPRPGNLNIWLAKSSDDGRTFSKPLKVNDDPDGPEHRFPTVASDTTGAVYVAWLDKRKGSSDRPGFSRVYFTKSTDGGRSFAPNVDASDGQESPICHCCRVALVAHARRGVFVAFRNVTWQEKAQDGATQIEVARVRLSAASKTARTPR